MTDWTTVRADKARLARFHELAEARLARRLSCAEAVGMALEAIVEAWENSADETGVRAELYGHAGRDFRRYVRLQRACLGIALSAMKDALDDPDRSRAHLTLASDLMAAAVADAEDDDPARGVEAEKARRRLLLVR